MAKFELTLEGTQVVGDSVREIATPKKSSWESTTALICFVFYLLTRPPVVSSRTPYLLGRSFPAFLADFIMLSICAGCGLSAARNRQRRGRLIGTIILAATLIAIYDWIHLLVNWQARFWG